ncbi:MAG TPA: protein jag [Nitratifractor sp.]|nr:protein jag [Nitratifractor sp.]HHD74978.1 protein jag [Nitratifractor sp.]
MKRFQAETLEEACSNAAAQLECSISELSYDIIQYPKKGFLGFFKKSAIIVATCKSLAQKSEDPVKNVQEISSQAIVEQEEPLAKEELQNSSEIVDEFFNESKLSNKPASIDAQRLEAKIKSLLSHSCFDIDTVEVDIEDNTVYLFIDGEDAALLIGKEGYRYNALSYILFNWINTSYGLYLKLEIAQFLASQQDMIKNQLQPVVEHVKRDGWGRTRELNGILVQIALEYLRDTFPSKYVAVKRSKSGERYIVINEFNKK